MHLKGVDRHPQFVGLLREQVPQPTRHGIDQDGAAVLRAPHDVVLQREGGTGVLRIATVHAVRLYRRRTSNLPVVVYSTHGGRRFPRRLKATVPSPDFYGGQSQFETWDPKPDAPAEVRGEFAPSPPPSPASSWASTCPRLARLADRYTIVRSVSHDDLDHGSATYLALTGRYHPQKSANPRRPDRFPDPRRRAEPDAADPDSPY